MQHKVDFKRLLGRLSGRFWGGFWRSGAVLRVKNGGRKGENVQQEREDKKRGQQEAKKRPKWEGILECGDHRGGR